MDKKQNQRNLSTKHSISAQYVYKGYLKKNRSEKSNGRTLKLCKKLVNDVSKDSKLEKLTALPLAKIQFSEVQLDEFSKKYGVFFSKQAAENQFEKT